MPYRHERESDQPSFDEERRLVTLQQYCVLDTEPEAEFNHLTELGAAFFRAPSAAISLVDKDRQFFKSRVGRLGIQTGRAFSFARTPDSKLTR